MKLFKFSIVFMLILSGMTLGHAQDEEGTETQVASSELTPLREPAVTSAGNVTLDFKDADITNVLRILSYKSGINIVAGQEVTGLLQYGLQMWRGTKPWK